ncbi:MAG: hypothetical protein ABIH63_01450 [archaeon]
MKLKFLLYVSALLVLSAVVMAAGNCTKEGGKDYFTAGVATVEGVGDSPDVCVGDKRLLEYYCNDAGKLEYEYYDCPDACVEGACSGESPELPSNETCTENWSCGDWSDCADSQQTRTCVDLNDCNTTTSKPVEVEVCVPEQPPVTPPASGLTQYRYYIIGGIVSLLIILYLVMKKKEPKVMETKEPEKKEEEKK